MGTGRVWQLRKPHLVGAIIIVAILLCGVPQALYALGSYPAAASSVEALQPCTLLPLAMVRTLIPQAKPFHHNYPGCDWNAASREESPDLLLILQPYRPGMLPTQTPQATAHQAFKNARWWPPDMTPIANLGEEAVGHAGDVPKAPTTMTIDLIQVRSGNVIWTLSYVDDRSFPRQQVLACARAVAKNVSDRL